MRIKLALSVLVFSSLACSANVTFPRSVPLPLPTNTQSVVVDTIQFSPTPLLDSQPEARTATPPLPTIAAPPLPQSLGVVPIKFKPDGTYLDVMDSIPSGGSKTYSVSALKGQVLSISVNQSLPDEWVYVPLRIVGADGTVLCPPQENMECQYWRGVLPAMQEYLITLTPVNGLNNFTLRLAINPPGTQTQSFQYVSPNTNTSFSYTDEFAPVRAPGYTISKTEPEVRLSYIDTQAYLDRNLVEAHFLFGSSNDQALVKDCLQISPLIPNEQLVNTVDINGKQFTHSKGSGVAAGSLYEQIMYRTLQNDICYEVTFLMHSFSTGSFLPQKAVLEFNREALLKKFEAILSTIVIK